jgi:hypothetical protein
MQQWRARVCGVIVVALVATSCQVAKLAGVSTSGFKAPDSGWKAPADDRYSKKDDAIRSGIVTDEMIEAQPYGFRVTWIDWDSPFRGTDLRIGDRITALDGRPYRLDTRKSDASLAIGQYAETTFWERKGGRDGQRVTLTVLRGTKTLDIGGKLRADRFYYAKNQKSALAPGGPERLVNDGFDSAWAGWHEKRLAFFTRVLDDGFRRHINNRQMLAELDEQKPRLDYLVTHYPGPYSETMKRDFDRVRDALLGKRRDLKPAALAYRDLGERRRVDMAALGRKARDAFVARLEGRIDAFPAVDPINGDRSAVTGKIVVLPVLGNRDWVMEADHAYMFAGDPKRGFYFIDSRLQAMQRIETAKLRYWKLVDPKLPDTYELIGKIQADPGMLVVSGRARNGLKLEIIGAFIGGAMFVDATKGQGRESPFAGEETVAKRSDIVVPPNAPPRRVIEALIESLKRGDEATWSSLFANWYFSRYDDKRFFFNPNYYRGAADDDWVRSRRYILDDLYDVEVVAVDPIRVVTTGKELKGVPAIEEVVVEIEHIGKFNGEFRPFLDVRVHRLWTLQRSNGGPWLITSRQGI